MSFIGDMFSMFGIRTTPGVKKPTFTNHYNLGVADDGLMELVEVEADVAIVSGASTSTGLSFPQYCIPVCAQANLETAVTATTATNVGLGITGGIEDIWGLSSGLTKNLKIGRFADNIPLLATYAAIALSVSLFACDSGGAAAGTLNTGTVRVRLVYWTIANLKDAA